MKRITFAVPCYNAQAYMRKCVDSLLAAGEDVEILIVNDGSSDDTARIADEYQAAHPGVVRAIHQENAGHGGAVNAGLRNATGQYFKVVDSDDWLDGDTVKRYMDLLNGFDGAVDMLITNFIYDKQGARHKMEMRYGDACPKDRVFTWAELGAFRPGEVFLMHALTFRTQLLRDCGLILPEHTFYVDNLVAYLPLPHVKTIYYADMLVYHYFIGRNDQSVNLPIMIRRQDQQLEVTRRLISGCRLSSLPDKRQKNYMLRYLEILMAVTSIVLVYDGSEEALAKKDAIWAFLRESDEPTYQRLRRGIIGMMCALRSAAGRWIVMKTYALCRRIYGFS